MFDQNKVISARNENYKLVPEKNYEAQLKVIGRVESHIILTYVHKEMVIDKNKFPKLKKLEIYGVPSRTNKMVNIFINHDGIVELIADLVNVYVQCNMPELKNVTLNNVQMFSMNNNKSLNVENIVLNNCENVEFYRIDNRNIIMQEHNTKTIIFRHKAHIKQFFTTGNFDNYGKSGIDAKIIVVTHDRTKPVTDESIVKLKKNTNMINRYVGTDNSRYNIPIASAIINSKKRTVENKKFVFYYPRRKRFKQEGSNSFSMEPKEIDIKFKFF